MTDSRTPDQVWAATHKPRVSRGTFDRRIAMGWDPERAANTSVEGRYSAASARNRSYAALSEDMGGTSAKTHEVLGRGRTLAQWAITSGIEEHNLRAGVRKHGTLQAFFLNIGWYPSKPATPGDPEITDDRFTD